MSETSHNSIYLDRLSSALVGAVEDGRIGLPRFVRWLERVDGEVSGDEVVTDTLDICNRLFGSSPTRQHRSGDGVKHQTLHAVWPNGSSALISFGPAGDRSVAGSEIMLLGSSGALYFDGVLGGMPTVEQVGRS